MESKLIVPGAGGNKTLALTVEPGMRAITVAVDQTNGLSGMIRPQDRVDLLSVLPTGTEETAETVGTVVAENLKVLAVDAVMDKAGMNSDGTPVAYGTITLEVTPKQAMELNMVVVSGPLRAVMRSPLDEKMVNVPNLGLKDIVAN